MEGFISTIEPIFANFLLEKGLDVIAFDRWGVDSIEDLFYMRAIDIVGVGIDQETYETLLRSVTVMDHVHSIP